MNKANRAPHVSNWMLNQVSL